MRLITVVVLATAVGVASSLGALAEGVSAGQLGQPLPDLTPAQLDAFHEGQKLFTQKPPGLGPLYNEETCISCHFIPSAGGSGGFERAVFVAPGEGGDVEFFRKQALPGWHVPAHPANVSRLVPPPLFGLGLIERVPDETIRAACVKGHPDNAKLLGSQPVNRVARFGVKPFVGTLPDFVDAALIGELGVTSPIDRAKDDDRIADPEVDRAFVETLAAYLRGLQPPGRDGNDAAGERVFVEVGCAGCHVPDMPPAMGVFSDLCVHGMGPALANGIIDSNAKSDEYRTTPLWGLRFRQVYMHDGRASSLEAAIDAHAGEAQSSADAVRTLPGEQRTALVRYLQTL